MSSVSVSRLLVLLLLALTSWMALVVVEALDVKDKILEQQQQGNVQEGEAAGALRAQIAAVIKQAMSPKEMEMDAEEVSAQYPPRKLSIVNKCSKDITIRFTGNSLPALGNGTTYQCFKDSDCQKLFNTKNPLICNPVAHMCYFALATKPSRLVRSQKSLVIDLPSKPVAVGVLQPTTGVLDVQNTIFAGKFVAATNCTKSGIWSMCSTGTQVDIFDTNNNKISNYANGVKDRPTSVETSFFWDREDTYDIQLLEGYNLPAQLVPDAGSFEQFLTTNFFSNCTAVGTDVDFPAPGPTGCPWTFNMSNFPYPAFVKILNTNDWADDHAANLCSTDADCENDANGNTCGLWVSSQFTTISLVCGPSVKALVLPNGICGMFPGTPIASKYANSPVNCTSTQFPNGNPIPNSDTQANVYGCHNTFNSSPYNPTANLNTCGYPVWGNGLELPDFRVASNSPTLVPPGQAWVDLYAAWLWEFKRACPMVYTYPYDDPTATFTCGPVQNSGVYNTANYTVTFCANGDGQFDAW